MKRGNWLKDPSVEEQYDTLLSISAKKSLKSDQEIWITCKELKEARNSLVHEGFAKLRNGTPIDASKAKTLIDGAAKIIEWVEAPLPEVHRRHNNRHTLITELAESGAGDQTIMDIAGHVSKQMLKHYSHIRMEAKRSALEAIVRKSSAQNESQQGYPQKSPQSPQNGGKTLNNGHAPEPMELAIAPKNGARDCSKSLGFTQDFEGEYPQKSPQSGIFEGHRGVGRGRKSLKRIGSSGRGRTNESQRIMWSIIPPISIYLT